MVTGQSCEDTYYEAMLFFLHTKGLTVKAYAVEMPSNSDDPRPVDSDFSISMRGYNHRTITSTTKTFKLQRSAKIDKRVKNGDRFLVSEKGWLEKLGVTNVVPYHATLEVVAECMAHLLEEVDSCGRKSLAMIVEIHRGLEEREQEL